ncbi:TIM barrel protein [Pricia sp. S334]|uniref:TIM barrel protein n=1 Tax=Pricia mediterranea TaxID=3076079 RepID=A0ABU3L1E5_9FLAO|nr:TIM barrel protein [Pricia sp. S334]MDT7827549.1 TIM barrel protein [Pricia sp. S334]
MNTRRNFLEKSVLATAAATILPAMSWAKGFRKPENNDLKLSLAQWSLHRALEKGEVQAVDFARIAKEDYNVSAVEYVNQFYMDKALNDQFWSQLKGRADDVGVKSLLIMVDNEGDLGNPVATDRKTAVTNHFKWVDAAKVLGCHSIRVNAFGKGTKPQLQAALVDGLGSLAGYGEKQDINVLVENHGLHTSDGAFMANILQQVDSPFLGTLPDFGNWCLSKQWGSIQNDDCEKVYDPYQGVADFLPYAKGVSAKSYAFDEKGNETIIDYRKMLQLVKDSGFDGYIGIEFEGETMAEPEGIRATKKLIEKVWSELD